MSPEPDEGLQIVQSADEVEAASRSAADASTAADALVPTRSILVLRQVLEQTLECWQKSSSPESMIFLWKKG